MTDCSSLIWWSSQWFISIPWPGNCLQNARNEKTHSDDLGQIEALPSATDNSSWERQQNFKGRGRDCLKTRWAADDKTRELISTQRSARQINTLLCECPWNEYSQSKLFTFSAPSNLQSYVLTQTHFSFCQCRAINCSAPLVNPRNTTWREMVSVFSSSTLALGKLVCKQRHASKNI